MVDRFETVNPWTRESWAEVALGGKGRRRTSRQPPHARAFDDDLAADGYGARQELLHRWRPHGDAHRRARQRGQPDMGKPAGLRPT